MSFENIRDILKTLPLIGHGVLRPLLEETLEHGTRYYSIDHAISEFNRWYNSGQSPNVVNSLKTPTLQVSSEWKNSGMAGEFEKIDSQVVAFRRSILKTLINAKEAEKKYFWDTYLSPTKIEALVAEKHAELSDELEEQYSVSTAAELPLKIQQDLTDLHMKSTNAVRSAFDLAYSRSLDKSNKAASKRKKKAAADVEMTGTGGAVNDKSLEKSVASILRRQEQSRRDKKKQGQVKGNIPFHDLSLSELTDPVANRQSKDREAEVLPKRLHFKRKILQETSSILESASKKMRLSRVGDYPEIFFASRLESRVLFIRMKTRVSILNTLRYMNFGVHKAHDVILPKNIEYFLAMNLKYIFPKFTNNSLGPKAHESLVSKIGSWFHFRDSRNTGDRLDAYLASVVERTPVDTEFTAHYISGIRLGRSMLDAVLAKTIPLRDVRLEPEPVFSEMGCTVKSLKEFMLLKQYMAFITDKNLGVAVVHRDWYMDEVLRHLRLEVYIPSTGVPWERLTEEYFKLFDEEGHPTGAELQFLINPDNRRLIPNFHAIPKIHKDPWKIRPIVPMHSYFTTRLAMWIHLYLHPLQKTYSWVCESSRSFVRDLLTETGGKKRTWKMFTGDVQSMYTNIRTNYLLSALREAMKKHGFSSNFSRWILLAVEFLNSSVFFQFSGQVFQQSYGIAMGMACGPTLANLFMAVWEDYIGVMEKFIFYRRYIDDIFALTTGEDPTDQVSVPGLVLDWESKDNIPFLDCEVHLHGQELCVRPYTKPLSHYQYIPWNSGHPRHVLKSMVKTELLRFSSISAKPSYFDERKKRLHLMLRARGWPKKALDAWMRQVKWRHPASRPRADRSTGTTAGRILVASEYNPLWNQVRLEPVWDEMTRKMARGPVQTPPFSGITMSLQRTTNLWDVVRRSNRDVVRADNPDGFTDHYDSQMEWQSVNTLVLR